MIRVFIDTSVLFAASYSEHGSARELVLLATDERLKAIVSIDVLDETDRNVRKKVPALYTVYQVVLAGLNAEVVPSPPLQAIAEAAVYTVIKDAPIVAAAILARPDYFVTYDRKHLLEPPEVTLRSGLTIVTPDVVVRAVNSID